MCAKCTNKLQSMKCNLSSANCTHTYKNCNVHLICYENRIKVVISLKMKNLRFSRFFALAMKNCKKKSSLSRTLKVTENWVNALDCLHILASIYPPHIVIIHHIGGAQLSFFSQINYVNGIEVPLTYFLRLKQNAIHLISR